MSTLALGLSPRSSAEIRVPLLVGEGHPGGLAPGQLVQGRHGGVDIAVLDEGPHEAEEEGEQQGADVGAVHVGIGHDDDLVIAQLVQVELVPDAGPQGGDDRAGACRCRRPCPPGPSPR